MAQDKKRGPEDFDLQGAPVTKRAKKKPTLGLEDLPKFIYDPEAGMWRRETDTFMSLFEVPF